MFWNNKICIFVTYIKNEVIAKLREGQEAKCEIDAYILKKIDLIG